MFVVKAKTSQGNQGAHAAHFHVTLASQSHAWACGHMLHPHIQPLPSLPGRPCSLHPYEHTRLTQQSGTLCLCICMHANASSCSQQVKG